MQIEKNKTHLFIDFSGDLGFKFNKGSTESVVFAMVIVEGTVEECWDTIATINKKTAKTRKVLSLPSSYEFKYHRSRKYFEQYWKILSNCNFGLRTVKIDKTKLNSREEIYPKIAEIFLQPTPLIHSQLYLDKIGSKKETRRFLQALKKELGRSILRKAKFQESRGNALLQLADMVAGALYEGKPNRVKLVRVRKKENHASSPR